MPQQRPTFLRRAYSTNAVDRLPGPQVASCPPFVLAFMMPCPQALHCRAADAHSFFCSWCLMNLPSTPAASRSLRLARCLLLTSVVACASISASNVAKASSDGRLDPGFGIDGVVTLQTDFAPSGVTALPDGGVVLSGVFLNEETAALIRLDADGALVESWGEDGIVRMPAVESLDLEPGFAATRFSSVFLLDDDRWLVTGAIENWGGGPSRICPLVVAFNADGSLDSTFGGEDAGGAVCVGGGEVHYSGKAAVPSVPGAAVDQGRLYVADARVMGVSGGVLPIRVHAIDFSGRVIESFGSGGTISMPAGVLAYSLDVGDDGELYAGSMVGVAKFSEQGDLDISFGDAGVASPALPEPWKVYHVAGIRVLGDRIFALGGILSGTGGVNSRLISFARMVWNLDGQAVAVPDAGEGPNVVGLSAWTGLGDTHWKPTLSYSENAGLLDRGGRSIIMAHELMRLTSEGSPDPLFGTGGRASFGWTQTAFQAMGMDSDSRLWFARQRLMPPSEGRFLEVLRFLAGGLYSDGFEPEPLP